MKKQTILEDYKEKKSLLEDLKPRVSSLILAFIKDNKIEVHDVQCRIKEISSLEKKIEKKHEKYSELSDITDVIGIRIITYFNDDVDKIAELIENEFIIDIANSIDKRVMDSDRFGYASLHYIVEFKPERMKFTEYKDFRNIKFEIQIRSILQHAWAEIEHDLGYKSKNEIPKEIRRDFSRISGLLELADKEFLRIKEFLANYTQEVESNIENKSLAFNIDKVTLEEYIEKSAIVTQIINELSKRTGQTSIQYYEDVASRNLDILEYFGISSIFQLDELLLKNEGKIIKFFIQFNKEELVDEEVFISNDTPLFFLYYVLIYQNYSYSYLVDYVKKAGISNELISTLSDTFDKYIEQKLLD